MAESSNSLDVHDHAAVLHGKVHVRLCKHDQGLILSLMSVS